MEEKAKGKNNLLAVVLIIVGIIVFFYLTAQASNKSYKDCLYEVEVRYPVTPRICTEGEDNPFRLFGCTNRADTNAGSRDRAIKKCQVDNGRPANY